MGRKGKVKITTVIRVNVSLSNDDDKYEYICLRNQKVGNTKIFQAGLKALSRRK